MQSTTQQAYIQQLEARIALLERSATTELPNEVVFKEELAVELKRANRYHTPLSLLYLDLNGLKTINDQYGHEAGDKVIAKVGQVLAEVRKFRATDIPCHLHGDEFAVILPHTNLAGAQAVAASIAENCLEQGASVAVGVIEYRPGEALAEGIARADMAMYEVKHG